MVLSRWCVGWYRLWPRQHWKYRELTTDLFEWCQKDDEVWKKQRAQMFWRWVTNRLRPDSVKRLLFIGRPAPSCRCRPITKRLPSCFICHRFSGEPINARGIIIQETDSQSNSHRSLSTLEESQGIPKIPSSIPNVHRERLERVFFFFSNTPTL